MSEALGRLSVGGPPVARDSIFRIASTTKPSPRRSYSPWPPFSEVLATRIFEPLGMRDTGFWAADTRRLATAYQPTRTGW